ncbi:hypothetical protein GEMRC1_002266 [Eukaryota sp. GEM-RC1]
MNCLNTIPQKNIASLLDHIYDCRGSKQNPDPEVLAANCGSDLDVQKHLDEVISYLETLPQDDQLLDFLISSKIETKTAKVIRAFYFAHRSEFAHSLMKPFRFRDTFDNFSWRLDMVNNETRALLQFKISPSDSDDVHTSQAFMTPEVIDKIKKKLDDVDSLLGDS